MSKTDKKFSIKAIQPVSLLGIVLAIGIAGCNKNSTPDQSASTASTPDATQVADDSQDPAVTANLAPAVNTTQSAPASSSSAASSSDQETAPPPPADDNSSYSSAPSDQSYNYEAPQSDAAQPVEYAPEPPPALPEYQQPECPGDNYMWTPGYWGYAQTGYYWVPGTWVVSPYVGALWTPGYWGFYGGRYGWHHGYWGPHIGFYGGVNYGYGYVGVGYVGGYWRNNAFMYNTSITRVNRTVITNVYVHNVTIINNTRISYNGGNGGINARPLPSENMAYREQHIGPLPEQANYARQMASNRQQWASVNRGRPALAVAAAPLVTSHRAPAPTPPAVQRQVSMEVARRNAVVNRPAAAARPAGEPGRPAPAVQPNRPGPEARPAVQPRPEARPGAPANRPAVQPGRPENRPAVQPTRPENRPAPAQRPEARPAPSRPAAQPARPEARPAPQQARPEARPAPQARPEARPAQPAARPETRPAPQQRPAAKPAPQQRPARPEEKHPNAR